MRTTSRRGLYGSKMPPNSGTTLLDPGHKVNADYKRSIQNEFRPGWLSAQVDTSTCTWYKSDFLISEG